MSVVDKSLVEVLAETAPMPDTGLAPPSPVAEPQRLPWTSRLFDTFSTYLPVLIMAVLALGTWWLVKNTPSVDDQRATPPLRHEPDYTMHQFMVQRFASEGALRVQIEGDELRHYPDTDTLEIDNPRIRATGPDGQVTVATAKHAISNGDGSEVQLSGAAHVVRESGKGDETMEFFGEFLHAFINAERVRSHLPVVVKQGATEIRAEGGMEFDNLTRVVRFKGKTQAVLSPARKDQQQP